MAPTVDTWPSVSWVRSPVTSTRRSAGGTAPCSPHSRCASAGRSPRPARGRRVGDGSPALGTQGSAGVHGAAAQGARRGRRSRRSSRAIDWPCQPTRSTARRFERMVGTEPRAAGLRRARARGLHADPGAGPLARRARSRTWRSGSSAVIEAGRLDELRLEAEELRVDAYLRTGRHLDVLADGREHGQGGARCGSGAGRCWRWRSTGRAADRGAADDPARKTLLADGSGSTRAELAALEEVILRQDGPCSREGRSSTSATCPYRGLTATTSTTPRRSSAATTTCVPAWSCCELARLVAVVGPSGSGKSSLVRAGVAAALRRDGHEVAIVTPGEHPMRALSRATDAARGSVLLVDQCEEVFSLCRTSRSGRIPRRGRRMGRQGRS